jgi:hypothetical protein
VAQLNGSTGFSLADVTRKMQKTCKPRITRNLTDRVFNRRKGSKGLQQSVSFQNLQSAWPLFCADVSSARTTKRFPSSASITIFDPSR